MLLRHAIGSVLRRIRAERGATLRELSEHSRVSVPYLSEIERGRKEASSEILAALCRVLGVSEGELLTRVAAEYAGAQVLTLVPERDEERGVATTTELQPALVGAAVQKPGVVALAA
ncbi:helix-turn-helix domain-containing protein [Leifsonia sp. RAF41]|uniref:helix-turn-helix domain-containing protein n=1 Tax=Leifsonia sp. RAF41 TaxID=3233056 RepID=UPI003F9D6AFA